MYRLSIALLFIGIAAMAHAAESGSIVFAHNLDLLTTQAIHFDLGGPASNTSFRFTANIGLNPSLGNPPYGSAFSNTLRLTPIVDPKKENIWATNSNWTQFFDSDRRTLAPLMRFESNGEQLEIKPRRHSFWVSWHKKFR